MLDTQIPIVRSRAISGTELVQAVKCIRDHTRRHDFVSRTHAEMHIAPLKVYELPVLDAYRSVSDVTIRTQACEPSKSANFVQMTKNTYGLSTMHAWTTWHVAESDAALESADIYDLTISAGLRKERYFCGVYVFRPSPAIDDLLRRAALYQHVISAIGLSEKIRVVMDGGVLRMKAQEPWKLSYPSAKSDGGDPSGFYASGFTNIDEAISAGQRLVQQFARKILGVSFVAKLPGEGYNAVFRDLNSIWRSWDLDIMGSFTAAAIDFLKGGELTPASPSRIPAFEWYGAKDWAAYGSVVIENGQRFLEIATDGVTAERLQDRIAFLDDLKFEFI